MKKFLLEFSLFSVVIIASVYIVFLQADGKSDPFYARTTSAKQTSLILGTSKAAQGLMPEILSPYLNREIYNFSFTVAHSPFGPTYLSAIQKKLNSKTKDGIFIITVDPWSIASDGENPDDEAQFDEANSFIGNTNSFSTNPNIQYLLDNFNDNYIKILWNKSLMEVHKDGWLEVSAPMDLEDINNRIAEKVIEQKLKLSQFQFSETRFNYLEKTIETLKKYGKVYLVRLPVYTDIVEIENELVPDFDLKIDELAQKQSVPYLNLINSGTKFTFTDGLHLYKDSAKKLSLEVAKWISTQQKLDQ